MDRPRDVPSFTAIRAAQKAAQFHIERMGKDCVWNNSFIEGLLLAAYDVDVKPLVAQLTRIAQIASGR